MSARRLATAVLVTAACAATGCGDSRVHRPPAPAAVARARSGSPQSTTSPAAAASGFARRWVNWDSRSLATQQRALARLAVGVLARQLRAEAKAPRDQPRGHIRLASRGRVVAASIKVVGARATGLVVTREQSYTDGHADLGGRRYRVYLLELVFADHRWSVDAWAPQP